jgi:ubiquinone/menaquinone biosynthesis C-methylase UbiE
MDKNPLGRAFYTLTVISPRLKRFLWRVWYNFIINLDNDAEFLFMNYGYAAIDGSDSSFPVPADQEKYRYRIQLYDHVAKAAGMTEMTGKKVLEVGCGCGGGAAYIAANFGPAAMKGLDYSQKAIEACNKYHTAVPNLTFVNGNAEELPFENESYDIVVNVESCHTYGKPARFFSEVARVLRPQGYLLIADFRGKPEVPLFRQQLLDTGLQLLHEENITPNIVKALELDDARKTGLIQPGIFQKPFQAFSGTKDSITYKTFNSGEMEYLYFVLQKGNAK